MANNVFQNRLNEVEQTKKAILLDEAAAERLSKKEAAANKRVQDEQDKIDKKHSLEIQKLYNEYNDTLKLKEALNSKLVAQQILIEFLENGGKSFASKRATIISNKDDILLGRINYDDSTYYFTTGLIGKEIVLSMYEAEKTRVSDGDHYPTFEDSTLYKRSDAILSSNGQIKDVRLKDYKSNILSVNYGHIPGTTYRDENYGFYVPEEYTTIIEPILNKVKALEKGESAPAGEKTN